MIDSLNSRQKKILIISLIIIIFGIMYYFYKNNNIKKSEINEEILISNDNTNNIKGTTSEDEEKIIVHVTGAVKTPGIVKLTEGSRIEDAINKAGGLTEDADITRVNLAYILDDGTKIKIPSSFDIENTQDEVLSNESGEKIIEENEKITQRSFLNINKATEQDLQQLPGIGQSLASKIISYRNENGKFSTVEDIKNVNGIGDSKYEDIRDYICVK